MIEGNDPKAVEEFAATNMEKEWPVQTVVLLSRLASRTSSSERVGVLLMRAQQQRPGDFWINNSLREFLRASRTRCLEDEIRFASVAVALQPQSPGAHLNLGVALLDKGQLDESIAEYREAIRLKKDYAEAHSNLGYALREKGQVDEAIAECREAIRIKNDHAEAHTNLGLCLAAKGRLDAAIAEYQAAIRLKKDYADAHFNLGNTLKNKGRLDEAIAEYREAIRLNKNYAVAHTNLGIALANKGLFDEAIVEYREALKQDFRQAYNAHNWLGITLKYKGRLDEAIAEYREAIRLNKNFSHAHNNLGVALAEKGQLDEAIAEYRQAIRLEQDHPEAHANLGLALLNQGNFQQAPEELRRAYELGSHNPVMCQSIATLLQKSERFAELDARLPRFLKGEEQPADAAERLALAGLCQLKKLYAASARWYGDAFAERPSLADDPASDDRHDAACTAALAAAGQGKDSASLDNQERGRLRRQALRWLKDDLQAKQRLLEKDPDRAGLMVRQQLCRWLQESDLNGVRGAEALAKLPEDERQSWQTFWAGVADTLAGSGGKAALKKKPDTK
jgi:Flp pilus assembly protein TadD